MSEQSHFNLPFHFIQERLQRSKMCPECFLSFPCPCKGGSWFSSDKLFFYNDIVQTFQRPGMARQIAICHAQQFFRGQMI